MKCVLPFGCFGAVAAMALFVCGSAHAAEQWPRWRGPLDNGSTDQGAYPVKWDAQKVLWKAALPGKGCSTPIIWNQKIFLTAPSNGLDAVLALDWSGKSVWLTTFGPEDAGKHRNGSGSNPSPTTDGQGIYAYFKSGTLAALDFAGKVKWQTNLVAAYGPANLYWDFGTSPVLTEKHVVMAKMHEGDSWLAAFDKAMGALAWKVPRNYQTPHEGDHGYTTPQIIRHDGREALLVWGGLHLTAHDAADGKLLWSVGDFNPEAKSMWASVANPVVVGDIAVVSTGRNDRNQPRLHGIKLGGSGDVTKTHRLWVRQDTGPFVPTPVEYRGKVYLLRDRGELECIEPTTGKTVWSAALPKDRNNYYSSPLIAGEKFYAIREDGVAFVAGIGNKVEMMSENNMGERVIASPVALANRLFIRGEKHLFCIGNAGL